MDNSFNDNLNNSESKYEKNYYDENISNSILDESFMDSATNEIIHKPDESFISNINKRKRAIFKDTLFVVSIIIAVYYALSTYSVTLKYF